MISPKLSFWLLLAFEIFHSATIMVTGIANVFPATAFYLEIKTKSLCYVLLNEILQMSIPNVVMWDFDPAINMLTFLAFHSRHNKMSAVFNMKFPTAVLFMLSKHGVVNLMKNN